jgi:hypothetical protein
MNLNETKLIQNAMKTLRYRNVVLLNNKQYNIYLFISFKYKYSLHTLCVGIRLWIRSILLWKPESLQVANVDATDKTLDKLFYEHTMYVISLSNISIKTHNTTFQTNNNGRIKIKKFVE